MFNILELELIVLGSKKKFIIILLHKGQDKHPLLLQGLCYILEEEVVHSLCKFRIVVEL